MVVEAAKSGDAITLRALEETGLYLGIGIANLINTFNPALVVFGGTLSQAADFLLPSIQRVVAERSMPWPREAAQILVAAHRFDSCVMGGVALVLHDMLSHPRLDAPIHHRPLPTKSSRKEVKPEIKIVKASSMPNIESLI